MKESLEMRSRRLNQWLLVKSRLRQFAPVLFVLTSLACTALAWRAFATPLETKRTVTLQTLKQGVQFDYTAMSRPSTLYPLVGRLGRLSKYLLKVSDQFQVSVKAVVSSAPDVTIRGTCQVILRLTAGDAWQKDYILSPEQEFTGQGKVAPVDTSYLIPLPEILSFIDKVGKETEVSPSTYSLTVSPIIKAHTEGDGAILDEFTPSFAFVFTQRELVPRGLARLGDSSYDAARDLNQEKIASSKTEIVTPGQMRVGNWNMPVVSARSGFGILSLIHLLVAIVWELNRVAAREPLSEAERIKQRHRKRIIQIREGSLDLGMNSVCLASFQKLVEIADEREKPIFLLRDDTSICRYGVPDGQTMFLYDASNEVPTKPQDPVFRWPLGGHKSKTS